jgi:hypothetical protein
MESRYTIGQLAQPAAHFVDFDDSRRSQPTVEHVRPLAHLWKHFAGRDGPCMRLNSLDGELAGQLIRIVPAIRQRKRKPCDRMLRKLSNELSTSRSRWSAYLLANPLAKQTRKGFFSVRLISKAKPYPCRQCCIGRETRNSSGTALPSTHASSRESSSPAASAFG